MPEELIEIELACQRAGHEGDGERAASGSGRDTGFLPQPGALPPDKLLAQFLDATWWYVLDEDIELEPEIATQVMIEMSDPRSSHFGQMRHETLPADHLFGRRVEMLTLAVLVAAARARQLPPDRARVDVRRAARHRARPPGGRVLRPRGRERSRAFWEDFYAGGRARWSGKPNASLVEEVAELVPRTALELGCGQGGDAIWLAAQGWTVTAADISAERARDRRAPRRRGGRRR